MKGNSGGGGINNIKLFIFGTLSWRLHQYSDDENSRRKKQDCRQEITESSTRLLTHVDPESKAAGKNVAWKMDLM